MPDLPLISVIIPMYNGYKNISRCLCQLDRQSIQDDYEVLIVDDASPDQSADKVEENITRLSHPERFRVIRCSENGRAGRARNIGIHEAQGEYVVFIDQDDYPDQDMLKTLSELTEQGQYDLTACDVIDKNGTTYHRYPCDHIEELTPELRQQIMKQFGYVFAILIRRRIILADNLFFPENVMFEDVLYNAGLLSCVQSINTSGKALYYRDDDENSQTAFFSRKKLIDRVKATEIYLESFQKSDLIVPQMSYIKQSAFYYIYLSCVWWILHKPDLFDKDFFQTCIVKSHALNISWKEIHASQRDFGKWRLFVMQGIYYVPWLGYIVLLNSRFINILRKIKRRLWKINNK